MGRKTANNGVYNYGYPCWRLRLGNGHILEISKSGLDTGGAQPSSSEPMRALSSFVAGGRTGVFNALKAGNHSTVFFQRG